MSFLTSGSSAARKVSIAFILAITLVVTAVVALTILSEAHAASEAAVAQSDQQPLAPDAAVITATVSDNTPTATKVTPGSTINYTAVISNTAGAGNDATNVVFSNPLDPNTTLVAGSVNTSPVAINESYSVYGNVNISIPDGATDLLGNDFDPDNGNNSGLTITTTGLFSSANCAGCNNVNINANGSFTYDPPVGFTGSDSFTYTVRDNGADGISGNADDTTAQGTVTLNISGMIWFINNAAGACTTLASQCGKLSKPFSSLDSFRAVNLGGANQPASGQDIFVYQGTTANTLTATLPLLANQRLIGQDAAPNATPINNATLFNITLPTGSATLPSTDTAGNAVTITGFGLSVASGDTIRGLSVTNTGVNTKLSGTGFGTLTLGNLILSGTGKALDLTNGTLATHANATAQFASIGVTSSASQGINLNTVSGALNSGGTTIAATTTQGINITSSGVATSFGNTSLTTTGGAAVNLTSNTGTHTFADLDISPNSGQKAFVATDNTSALTATSGDITTSGANSRAIEIDGPAGRTPINLTFTSVTASNAINSVSLVDISGTKFQITGTTQINTRAGTGVFVDNSTVPTIQFGATNVPNPSAAGGHGIRIEDSSSAVTIASATISNAAQTVAQTDADNNGFPENDADGDAIFLKNNTGSFTLNGPSTLSSSAGDGIDIRTASNLTLNNVTINGVGSFVGATGNAGGIGGHGIFAWNLSGTNAITNSTIMSWTANATNAFRWYIQNALTGTTTIKGTTFKDSFGANVPSGAVLYRGDGTSVSTLNVGGAGAGEGCLFTNIIGEAIGHGAGNSFGSTARADLNVINNSFTNAPNLGQNSISARNTFSGRGIVVISGNTFDNVGNTLADTSGVIDIGADATDAGAVAAGAFIHFTITNNIINNIGQNTGDCDGAGAGTLPCQGKRAIDVFIDDNSIIGNDTNPAVDADDAIVISNNTITDVVRMGIVFDAGGVFNGSNYAAKITNNCVGRGRLNPNDATCTGAISRVGYGNVLGAGGENGIRIENRSTFGKDLNILVSNNEIYNGSGAAGSLLNSSGLLIRPQSTATMTATVNNNVVNVSNTTTSYGFNVQTSGPAGSNPTLCFDATGNTITAPGGGFSLSEVFGALNVEQSQANLSSLNGGSLVTINSGTPQFSVACAAPPPIAPPASDTEPAVDSASLSGSAERASSEFSDMIEPLSVNQESSSPTLTVTGELRGRTAEPPQDARHGNHRSSISNALNSLRRFVVELDSLVIPTAHAGDTGAGNPNAPNAGETITVNGAGTGFTLPAGKSITVTFRATVNTTALTARQATTQGTVTATGGINVTSDDPDVGGTQSTVTLLDTTLTWIGTGTTPTDWNDPTNWNRPGPVVSSYAPGVSNPAVNDVVIPNVGGQPTIGTTDIGVYSLNLANGRTLTITNPRILTIGGSPGGDLTLDGIISGGNLNLGTGAHAINNAGGTGSLSATNLATVLSGSIVTLNNNLQMGALGVSPGGSMTIANRTLSLNGVNGLVVPGGTFTTTGSTVIFNGTAAQQAAGIAYNNLTINNTAAGAPNALGATLLGNATVNGVLALTSNDLNTGAFTLTQPNTTASTGAGDVVGTVLRSNGGVSFGLISLTFGNPNNIITFTGAGTRPTTMTAVLGKVAPATYSAAVQRNYTLSQTGGAGFTATVRLHYLDTELNGNTPEGSLGLRRLRTADNHWVAAPPPPGIPNRDGSANWVEATGVLAADLTTQWTFSTLAPTAADSVITGQILDNDGNPVEGAVVRLEGTQNRKFITDANGVYRFENVESTGFYTVTPSRVNYSFSPATRSFNQVGETTNAAFSALVVTSNLENPLDTPEYFVRQHYLDFLGREPDEAGFNFWSDEIIRCAFDQECIGRKRENVSAAFFLSIEFQNTGGLVDGLNRASYGVRPAYAQFIPDARKVGHGVRVGFDGWEAVLQTNKEAFTVEFVNRPAFHAMYDGMDNSLFVDTLISHTGVSFTSSERDALVSGLSQGTMTRAEALTAIAENQKFVSAKLNDAFVMMEYFGYLRRDADPSGLQYWLNKLNHFNGNFEQAEMVKAFIVSSEYRDRFPK